MIDLSAALPFDPAWWPRLEQDLRLEVGGLHGAAMGGFLARALAEGRPGCAGPVLVVVPDALHETAMRLDLEAFLGRAPLPFPSWPRLSGSSAPDLDVLVRRTRVLEELRRREGHERTTIVAGLQALAQAVPSRTVFAAAHVRLRRDEERSFDVLLEHLAGVGFVRVPAVGGPGEMAMRGGVFDVWPHGAREPYRLDAFGDRIESIHRLDPTTQRSGEALEEAEILALDPDRLREPHAGEGATSLLAWLPPEAPVVLVERDLLVEAAPQAEPLARGRFGTSSADAVRGLERELATRRTWTLSAGPPSAAGIHAPVASLDRLRGAAFTGRSRGGSAAGTKSLAETLRETMAAHRATYVFRRAEGEEERLHDLLGEAGVAGRPTWRYGSLSRSFAWLDGPVAFVAYDDFVELPLRDRRSADLERRSRPIQDFLELEAGGLVVHRHHGIGLFQGVHAIPGPTGDGEYLSIAFAEGTVVHVPVQRIDLVQRYVGTGKRPRLSKVGGTEWEQRKSRVEAAVEALAHDLLELQARRQGRFSLPHAPDSPWQAEFEAAFHHTPTPDQTAAIEAIKADLEGNKPLDRLLCGDVGFGKTEVALRAVFKTIAGGRQAGVLVPTKVLAQQHLRTFQARFAPYPFSVRALTSLESAADNRRTLADLAAGRLDVVVGTHRLLSRDVAFQNLGLVVVDEEQRFGVKHKERLKVLRADVDVLSLSATPIPRTLHMTLLGLRDISNLTTPPLGRHAIETRVVREDDALVRDALRLELDRGGQVYVVNPTIRDLPMLARRLQELVPDARFATIHGRMDKEHIESCLMRFVSGEVDVLLATTIVESGLDIPNANTIVIRHAHRYGLAELHQLRGRVGRERRRAHALLLVPQDVGLKPEAAERLRAVEEYSELGAGFRIAMRDLEIRGAGNLLGPEQSGHIAAVGYELYCRLLQDAVDDAKGETRSRPRLADIGFDVPGRIPEGWAGDLRVRMAVYRRLAGLETTAEWNAVRDELVDRHGSIPPEVERLLGVQGARIRLGALGVERVERGPRDLPGLVLVLVEGRSASEWAERRGARCLDARRVFVPFPASSGSPTPSPEDMLLALFARLDAAGSAPPPPRRRR